MTPEEFYDDVEIGDYVELRWSDGAKQIKVAGVMCADDTVRVLSTGGMMFTLREGHSARIISRAGIKKAW